MADEHNELFKKSQEFLQMLGKQKGFIEDILKENERLRYRAASFKANKSDQKGLQVELEAMRRKLEALETEKKALQALFSKVEEENKDFAQRYVEVEEQNNNLANLYVASYQLHSTLDFQEVVNIVMEIVINLVGAEAFSIMLLDERTNELGVIAHEGLSEDSPYPSIKIGEGIIGGVVKTGEPYYINQAEPGYKVDFYHPIASIALKIKEHVTGVINVYKLLTQKDAFTAVDYELFSLLAAHAATAIFSSKLYSQSERKLNTIQGFLDLLTAPAAEKI